MVPREGSQELGGTIAIHLTEPTVVEWTGAATCFPEARGAGFFQMKYGPAISWINSFEVARLDGRPVSASISLLDELALDIHQIPDEGTLAAAYTNDANRGGTLALETLGPDGYSGHLHFGLVLGAGSPMPLGPASDRLEGSLDWRCDPAAPQIP